MTEDNDHDGDDAEEEMSGRCSLWDVRNEQFGVNMVVMALGTCHLPDCRELGIMHINGLPACGLHVTSVGALALAEVCRDRNVPDADRAALLEHMTEALTEVRVAMSVEEPPL